MDDWWFARRAAWQEFDAWARLRGAGAPLSWVREWRDAHRLLEFQLRLRLPTRARARDRTVEQADRHPGLPDVVGREDRPNAEGQRRLGSGEIGVGAPQVPLYKVAYQL